VEPIRPDGFFVLDLGGDRGRTACFVELQRASHPIAFRRKARAYMAYWASGAYERRFAQRSLRVLAVATSAERALHLKAAVEQEGGATLFWMTPFGPVWWVGGVSGRRGLLDGAGRGAQAVAVGRSVADESAPSDRSPDSGDRTLDQGLFSR
jgi:hypothetical protein